MRRLQQVMLETSTGALRPVWKAAYAAAARGLAAYLRRGNPEVAVYLRGSFGFGEPVYGISDLDVIAVSPHGGAAIRRRWKGLATEVPLLTHLAPDVHVYDDEELRRAVAEPCLTSSETFLRRDTVCDDAELTVRPGPFGATREWRLLAGPERRPASVERDAQSRRIAAWLELQFWWRIAFAAALRPRALYVPFVCLKLIAEPARLWLWLAEGRALLSRRDVLREALARLPEEAESFRMALELERALPDLPEPPLASALAPFARLSTRLAALVAAAVEQAGTTRVRLVGADLQPLPLLDWRALVAPASGPESFALVDGDAADPATLARFAASPDEPQPTLRARGLLVRPALGGRRTKLRAVQCAATDPVSFALADGRAEAVFPMLAGWSAADWARRAVAENRVWLEASTPPSPNGHLWIDPPPASTETGVATRDRLLAGARAALLHESIEDGAPTLTVSADAVADRIGADPQDVSALRRAVKGLRSYR